MKRKQSGADLAAAVKNGVADGSFIPLSPVARTDERPDNEGLGNVSCVLFVTKGIRESVMGEGMRFVAADKSIGALVGKVRPRDDDADCEAAIALVRTTRQASVSHFQWHLGWGRNRAARVLDLLQTRGIVGAKTGEQAYEILKSEE